MSSVRRVAIACAVSFLVVLSAGSSAGAAAETVKPGTASGAAVAQTGWWWRGNDNPAEDNPVGPPPSPPAPPNVPENALPVSAAAGDAEKVSAIEFALEYGLGATVSSMHLTLKESGEPGANINADSPDSKVVACPITESFWVPETAGRWTKKPSYECDQAVAGERGKTGVWTFDLTSLAATWLAKDSTSLPAVVLVEKVDAPNSFQVAYDGSPKGVGVKLVASGGAPPVAPPPPPGSGGSGDSGLASGGSASSDAGSGAPADAGGLSGDVPAAGDAAPTAAGAPDAATPQAAEQQTASPATRLVGLFEDLPAGALVLLPLVLGLAYLTMLALGPNGEPVLATSRHGVGRALDRMRALRATAKETE